MKLSRFSFALALAAALGWAVPAPQAFCDSGEVNLSQSAGQSGSPSYQAAQSYDPYSSLLSEGCHRGYGDSCPAIPSANAVTANFAPAEEAGLEFAAPPEPDDSLASEDSYISAQAVSITAIPPSPVPNYGFARQSEADAEFAPSGCFSPGYPHPGYQHPSYGYAHTLPTGQGWFTSPVANPPVNTLSEQDDANSETAADVLLEESLAEESLLDEVSNQIDEISTQGEAEINLIEEPADETAEEAAQQELEEAAEVDPAPADATTAAEETLEYAPYDAYDYEGEWYGPYDATKIPTPTPEVQAAPEATAASSHDWAVEEDHWAVIDASEEPAAESTVETATDEPATEDPSSESTDNDYTTDEYSTDEYTAAEYSADDYQTAENSAGGYPAYDANSEYSEDEYSQADPGDSTPTESDSAETSEAPALEEAAALELAHSYDAADDEDVAAIPAVREAHDDWFYRETYGYGPRYDYDMYGCEKYAAEYYAILAAQAQATPAKPVVAQEFPWDYVYRLELGDIAAEDQPAETQIPFAPVNSQATPASAPAEDPAVPAGEDFDPSALISQAQDMLPQWQVAGLWEQTKACVQSAPLLEVARQTFADERVCTPHASSVLLSPAEDSAQDSPAVVRVLDREGALLELAELLDSASQALRMLSRHLTRLASAEALEGTMHPSATLPDRTEGDVETR